jgi:hypothetical protein
LVAPVPEERLVELPGTIQPVFVHMVAQKLDCVSHQRYSTHLAALPQEAQLLGWIQSYISDRKVYQLLDARPGVVEDAQQDRVSPTSLGSEVRLCQHLSQFRLGKVGDRGSSASLLGNGEDFLTLEHTVRFFSLHVSEECVQSSKPMVSRAGRRLPLCFQVIQEAFHHGDVDLFEVQSLRRDSLYVTAKSQKESKHVAVRLDRVGADIPLRG